MAIMLSMVVGWSDVYVSERGLGLIEPPIWGFGFFLECSDPFDSAPNDLFTNISSIHQIAISVTISMKCKVA